MRVGGRGESLSNDCSVFDRFLENGGTHNPAMLGTQFRAEKIQIYVYNKI